MKKNKQTLLWVAFAGSLLMLSKSQVTAQTFVEVLNPGFEDGTGASAENWTSVEGDGTNSVPANYREAIPGLAPNFTMQIKSDGGNYIEQVLTQTVGGDPVDASSFDTWSVAFLQDYRTDGTRNGDHTIRVSLWNVDTDTELAATEFTQTDPGVTGPNTLSTKVLQLSYDTSDPSLVGQQVALRFTSVSADLGGNAWQRTAIIDDVVLVGGGADPIIEIEESFAFNNLDADVVYTLEFTNTGANEDLVISEILVSGPDAQDFTVQSFTSSVAPGATGTIEVLFESFGPGPPYEATLEIQSNALLTPSVFTDLIVTVISSEASFSADRVDFGTFPTPTTAATQSITVTNVQGTEDLFFSSATFLESGVSFSR